MMMMVEMEAVGVCASMRVCVEFFKARSFGCKLFDGVSTDFIVSLGEGARGWGMVTGLD